MSVSSFWLLRPESPALSLLVLALLAMAFLYAARRPMHELVRAVGHVAGGPLRIASRWLLAGADEMRERNKAVLLAHGRREDEQHIAREFERIAALVRRDLEGYPALQRKLLDEITRVEEDYKKCGEVPPPPPDWVEAVDAVAKVKNGNELVTRARGDQPLDQTIHDRTLGEYREAYESRHKILRSFMPFWRSLERTLAQVDKNITGLHNSAAQIDAQMAKYEEIVEQDRQGGARADGLGADAVRHRAAGDGGRRRRRASINYKLIALPMSEMVGAGDYLTASLRTSEVAALVIIFVEATMGLFLMETLRITHLFPGIHNLTDRVRRRMMWLAFGLLVTLAGIEAALALMRDMLIADKPALLQSLATVQHAAAADGWVGGIPTAGQMLLGFILPFALAFIAIPLESLIDSARTVGGALLVVLARGVAFVLRFAGNLVRQAGRVLVTLYDVVIVLPLWLERLAKGARRKPTRSDAGETSLQPKEET